MQYFYYLIHIRIYFVPLKLCEINVEFIFYLLHSQQAEFTRCNIILPTIAANNWSTVFSNLSIFPRVCGYYVNAIIDITISDDAACITLLLLLLCRKYNRH